MGGHNLPIRPSTRTSLRNPQCHVQYTSLHCRTVPPAEMTARLTSFAFSGSQQATFETRSPKHEPRSLSEQRTCWRNEAAQVLGDEFTVAIVIAAFAPDQHLAANLANLFRKHFRLEGAPVRVEFRADDNPFKGRRNPLTPRQVRSRKRLLKRVKR